MLLRFIIVIALIVVVGWSSVSAAPRAEPLTPAAVGTAFTYQGRLTLNGVVASGTYDFQFALYDALSGGAQAGSTVNRDDISVTEGLFTVSLDFGANAFNGNPRYLQVEVRPGDSTGSYTLLTPRQLLTPAPYAMYTTNADQLDGVHASGFLSSVGGTLTGNLEIYAEDAELRLNDATDTTVEAAIRANDENLEIVEVEDTTSAPQSSLGGNVWMMLEDGGRIGIGTTNPAAKLQVTADNSQRALYLSGGPAITSSMTSKWNLPPTSGNGTLSFMTADWDAASGIGFIQGANVASPVVWMYDYNGSNAFTVASKAYAGTGENVSTIDPYLTPLFQVRENGNVGIGTVSPQAKLEVSGGSVLLDANASLFGNATSGNRGFLQLYNGTTGDLSLGTTFSTGDVSISAGNAEKLRIQADNVLRVPYGFSLVQGSGKNVLEDRSSYGDSLRVGYNSGAAQFTAGVFIYGGGTNLGVAVRNNGRVGIGTSNPQQTLDISGTTRTKVVQITGGADLAEPFDVSGDQIMPGFVVSIDPDRPGELRISDRAYDKTVAGCISGANGVNPGLVMQHEGTSADGKYPVALSGRVYCYADASFGAIQPGDLLTTSDTPGHLQAATDYDRAHGAIVGKAMSSLTDGRDLILVLVTLQ